MKTEQWMPRQLDELFSFFADAENLEQLTPPWLHFRIVSPAIEIRAGTLIDYRLRVHGIPLKWQSKITGWKPPFRFIDVQTRGPYRAWIHEHTFEASKGGTLMKDRVQYAVVGGALVRKFLVAPDLERIFSFRKVRLECLFGGDH
ncbi:MAG TPA: SRPBCC family protein [Terriglobia bacterium]|jgi:ligand-binding SRPBCC domain-containing protein